MRGACSKTRRNEAASLPKSRLVTAGLASLGIDLSTTGGAVAEVTRLAESVADLEYAIRTHEFFTRWFSRALVVHIVLSIMLLCTARATHLGRHSFRTEVVLMSMRHALLIALFLFVALFATAYLFASHAGEQPSDVFTQDILAAYGKSRCVVRGPRVSGA